MRKAKIVCTGPASDHLESLDRLIEQGMNAARLNFSHGTHESHAAAIKTIRHAADQRRAPVCIIQDLQGPRTVEVPGASAWKNDNPVTADHAGPIRRSLGHQSLAASGMIELPVTYQHLAQDVRPGSKILINGLIELAVERINGGAIDCKVLIGGTVTSHKGINLPGTRVSAPTLTDKDRDDIRFGVAEESTTWRCLSSEGRTTSGRPRNSLQPAGAARRHCKNRAAGSDDVSRCHLGGGSA